MGIIGMLLVGAAAGWMAGQIMKGRGFGVLGNIGVGVLGAILGRALFRMVGIHAHGTLGTLITALAGAVVLLAIVGAVQKKA